MQAILWLRGSRPLPFLRSASYAVREGVSALQRRARHFLSGCTVDPRGCRLLVAKTIPKTSSQAIPGGSVGPRRLPSCALRLTPCGSALPLSTAAFLSYPGELWTLAEKCGSPERSRLPNIARNLRLLGEIWGHSFGRVGGRGTALGEIRGHGLKNPD